MGGGELFYTTSHFLCPLHTLWLQLKTATMATSKGNSKVAFNNWKYRHYFSLLEIKGKNVYVSCTLCPGKKTLSTSATSNSNLIKHLTSTVSSREGNGDTLKQTMLDLLYWIFKSWIVFCLLCNGIQVQRIALLKGWVGDLRNASRFWKYTTQMVLPPLLQRWLWLHPFQVPGRAIMHEREQRCARASQASVGFRLTTWHYIQL